MPVEDGLRDARLGGDGVHRGLGAVPQHDAVRRLQKLPPTAFGRSRLTGLRSGVHDVFLSPPLRWCVTPTQRNTPHTLAIESASLDSAYRPVTDCGHCSGYLQ
ncbi:hypothetical protein Slala05_44860 [Streptomyces lavendulae subsp. lavendulae]|nr:hypothetical protein Slala05_44860 [Streptomyces lavendulae subsp. lavendulae]